MKPIPIPGRKKVHQASAKPKFKERKFVIEWHSNEKNRSRKRGLGVFFFKKMNYSRIIVVTG